MMGGTRGSEKEELREMRQNKCVEKVSENYKSRNWKVRRNARKG